MWFKLNISFITLLFLLQLNQPCFTQDKKILFLGNSYTAANNLPMLVSELAKSLGDTVYYDSNTPGGSRLMNHATNTTTLSKINSEDWDFVIIQAQSQEPSLEPGILEEEVFPYAEILNDSIKANNICTETVFYMTWGRKYGDQQNCDEWPPVCNYLGMQERLASGYVLMAENNNATVAPVGLAWKQSMDNDPDSLINLYSGDNSHPSVAGSYLTACVMYATMFQKTPSGSNYYGGLAMDQAIYLQQIASYVVLDEAYGFSFYDPYFEINFNLTWLDWFENGSIVLADFFIASIGAEYNFTSQTINAEEFLWDFGDGNTSMIENPQHTYEYSGEYIVSLTASNLCFSNMASDTLNVLVSDINQSPENNTISIFQNPGTQNIVISFICEAKLSTLKFEVFGIGGNLLKTDYPVNHKIAYESVIDMTEYNPGLYFLRVSFDEQMLTKKIILK